MGQCFAPECKYQVQWAASRLGTTCSRIGLCYMLSEVKSRGGHRCTQVNYGSVRVLMTNLDSGQSPGTTHIYRSAQASGSPRTNSTSMTPNCCSSALLLNNHSAWILEEEDGRATYTSFPTSSILCFMSSTRTYPSAVLAAIVTAQICRRNQLMRM